MGAPGFKRIARGLRERQAAADAAAARPSTPPDNLAQAVLIFCAAARSHAWTQACQRLDELATFGKLSARVAEMASVARLYCRDQDPPGAKVRRLSGVDVRYINLDQDEERRARLESTFQACGLELIRSPGVRGGWLPRLAWTLVGARAGNKSQGVLGCFLSHARAWDLVAASDRASLIVEDDALPLFRLASVLERVSQEVDDICFVNHRMSHVLRKLHPHPQDFQLIPMHSTPDLHTSLPNAPGADGYILTPRGARRLLAYATEDGCLGHVDNQMLSYCLPLAGHAVTAESPLLLQRLKGVADLHQGVRELEASVLYPPLVEEADGESSRRRG